MEPNVISKRNEKIVSDITLLYGEEQGIHADHLNFSRRMEGTYGTDCLVGSGQNFLIVRRSYSWNGLKLEVLAWGKMVAFGLVSFF